MALFKRVICAFIALSFIFAGIPVQAKPMPCPMAKMHAEMQMSSTASDMPVMKMSMKDCDKCPKAGENKQAEKTKKGGCCDDPTCNAKCAAMSSAGSQLFPSDVVQWTTPSKKERVALLPYLLPASHALKTPEKPPKYLS